MKRFCHVALNRGLPGFVGVGLGVPASTLTAAELILITGNLVYPPQFDIGFDDTYTVGDTITARRRDKAGAITWTSVPHVITTPESVDTSAGTTGKAVLDFSSFVGGTNRFEVFGQKTGQFPGPVSNIITQGPDDLEPTLTLPISANVFATLGTVGITTDEANGNLYMVIVTGAQPSKAQIKAGQTSAGAAVAATLKGTLAITTIGAKEFNFTGSVASTSYTAYFMHEDAAANQSAIGSKAFTTAAVDPSVWDPASVNGNMTISGSGRIVTQTTPSGGNEFYDATVHSSGDYWIEYELTMVSGADVWPGLKDIGSGNLVNWQGNGLTNTGTTWGAGSGGDNFNTPGTYKIMFFISRTHGMIYGYFNGVRVGPGIAIPGGLVNPRPYGRAGSSVGCALKINTGQETPMGGVPTVTVGATTVTASSWG